MARANAPRTRAKEDAVTRTRPRTRPQHVGVGRGPVVDRAGEGKAPDRDAPAPPRPGAEQRAPLLTRPVLGAVRAVIAIPELASRERHDPTPHPRRPLQHRRRATRDRRRRGRNRRAERARRSKCPEERHEHDASPRHPSPSRRAAAECLHARAKPGCAEGMAAEEKHVWIGAIRLEAVSAHFVWVAGSGRSGGSPALAVAVTRRWWCDAWLRSRRTQASTRPQRRTRPASAAAPGPALVRRSPVCRGRRSPLR